MSTSKQVVRCANPARSRGLSCNSISNDDAAATDTALRPSGNSVLNHVGKSSRGRKKIVIYANGMIADKLGKDYASRSPADVVKARDPDINVTKHRNSITTSEGVDVVHEACDSFPGGSSNVASSSNIASTSLTKLSYCDALKNATPPAASVRHTSLAASVRATSLKQAQGGWESSFKHECVNVTDTILVKKFRSFMPKQETAEKQLSPPMGNTHQQRREKGNKHWNSSKTHEEKGKAAELRGDVEGAKVSYEDRRKSIERARQEDKTTSQKEFDIRNANIHNRLKMNLCELETGKGLHIVKYHLLFGICARSVRIFRITTGDPEMKEAVVDLLKKEKIKWKELNTRTLTFNLDISKATFAFMACADDPYAGGKAQFEKFLLEQGRMCTGEQTDKRSTSEDPISFDLHLQNPQEGVNILKLHLLFGAYFGLRHFRVITGSGKNHKGFSPLKERVVDLLKGENIKFEEENEGALLIELDEQKRELRFVDCDGESD